MIGIPTGAAPCLPIIHINVVDVIGEIVRLHFDRTLFDAVLCLNGAIDTDVLEQYFSNVPIIAADGAANTLYSHGIIPDMVVGDLDSVLDDTLEAVRPYSQIVQIVDQDITDFEKSLRVSQSQLWNRVLVTGLHGGDLEHTLNNWSVFYRYAQTQPLTILDGNRYVISVVDSLLVALQPGEIVSLIPQPSARISTSGLQWNLDDESLEMGIREGARNRITETEARIQIHQGSLLFVFNARLPFAPVLSD